MRSRGERIVPVELRTNSQGSRGIRVSENSITPKKVTKLLTVLLENKKKKTYIGRAGRDPDFFIKTLPNLESMKSGLEISLL